MYLRNDLEGQVKFKKFGFFFFFGVPYQNMAWRERASMWSVPLFFVSYLKYHSTLSCTVHACGLTIQLSLLGSRDIHTMVQSALERIELGRKLSTTGHGILRSRGSRS